MAALSEVLAAIQAFEPPRLLAEKNPVVIYGAGGFGRDVADALRQTGRELIGFLDGKVRGEVLDLPCRSLETDLGDWLARRPTVLIALHNYQTNPIPVREQLQDLGFTRVYLPTEYHAALEPQLGGRYWLGSQHIYRDHLKELEEVFALLADEKSQQLFLSTLEYRALMKAEAHPTAEPQQAYFPEDIPRWQEPLAWIDGGACDGDTLRAFPWGRYQCRRVDAFEPDPINFATLQKVLPDFQTESPGTEAEAWACGLGAERKTISFETGRGAASAASAGGTVTCDIVDVDSWRQDREINLIKLDIEGAEPDALRGAEKTIAELKPGLAVCIYHTPAHLWEIPLMIARKHSGYRFYLRCHGESSFDLVLYAVY